MLTNDSRFDISLWKRIRLFVLHSHLYWIFSGFNFYTNYFMTYIRLQFIMIYNYNTDRSNSSSLLRPILSAVVYVHPAVCLKLCKVFLVPVVVDPSVSLALWYRFCSSSTCTCPHYHTKKLSFSAFRPRRYV